MFVVIVLVRYEGGVCVCLYACMCELRLNERTKE